MDNRDNHHNRRKYSLKVHIVLVTKYRKQLFNGSIIDDVKQKIYDICNSKGYDIIAIETDKDHMHILISYDATDRVCDIKPSNKKQLITCGKNTQTFCLNSIGKRKSFGRMATLPVVQGRYHQQPYKSTLKTKANGYKFTRLLPPPKGSGFLPSTTERILFMK